MIKSKCAEDENGGLLHAEDRADFFGKFNNSYWTNRAATSTSKFGSKLGTFPTGGDATESTIPTSTSLVPKLRQGMGLGALETAIQQRGKGMHGAPPGEVQGEVLRLMAELQRLEMGHSAFAILDALLASPDVRRVDEDENQNFLSWSRTILSSQTPPVPKSVPAPVFSFAEPSGAASETALAFKTPAGDSDSDELVDLTLTDSPASEREEEAPLGRTGGVAGGASCVALALEEEAEASNLSFALAESLGGYGSRSLGKQTAPARQKAMMQSQMRGVSAMADRSKEYRSNVRAADSARLQRRVENGSALDLDRLAREPQVDSHMFVLMSLSFPSLASLPSYFRMLQPAQ